jgi:hypothetical protein
MSGAGAEDIFSEARTNLAADDRGLSREMIFQVTACAANIAAGVLIALILRTLRVSTSKGSKPRAWSDRKIPFEAIPSERSEFLPFSPNETFRIS